MNDFSSQLTHPVFKVVGKVAKDDNLEVYVVGGFVRDLILNRPRKDIDIVVVGDGEDLARKTAEILRVKNVSVFKNFGTASFRYKDIDVEFVGARKESYKQDSRKPVVEKGTLQDDQRRRDFTINAMGISLQYNNFGMLIDPFDGLSDLKKQVIQTPLDPDITFSDDPLRMMRAVRFATQLDFKISPQCMDSILRNAQRLEIISKERIISEFNKIILSEKPSRGFKLLDALQLLHHFFPEFIALRGVETIDGKSHKDNFYHTLEVLDNVAEHSNNLWLRWAAILHDIAKPNTKRFDPKIGWTFHGHEDFGARMVSKIFARLRLPLDSKMRYVRKLVRLHLRPIALVKGNVTDSAVRRLLFEAGSDIDDLMLLCNADITSKNEFKVKKYRQNFQIVEKKLRDIEEKDRIRNFQPPISGEVIIKTFNLQPCREIGEIKMRIKDAILEGTIPNEYDAAYQYMMELGKELKLIN